MIIDSHHHLWQYNEKDFSWIDHSMVEIKKSFLEDAYQEVLSKADYSIVVQARQSLEETDFLLDFASKNTKVAGVIGWVDLLKPAVGKDLEKYSSNPVFKGVRHVLHDESDPEFMLNPRFIDGLRAIEKRHLIYELLIFPQHLENTITLVKQLPGLSFILDHMAKPNIKTGEIDLWKRGINALAKQVNVSVKLSGMVTEHHWKNWEKEDFYDYLDVVYNAFGEDRVLFGSDWPVCLLSASYDETLNIVLSWSQKLTRLQREKLFYKNASKLYSIDI